MGGGGLGGLFAGGMPKLKKAGERRPPGGKWNGNTMNFIQPLQGRS